MNIFLIPLLLTMPLCDELRAELQWAVELGIINEQSAESVSNRCVEPPKYHYEIIQPTEASLES